MNRHIHIEELQNISILRNARLGSVLIQEKLSYGAFGQVYSGVDIVTGTHVVVKFTQEHEMNDSEYGILLEIHNKSSSNFAKAFNKGQVIITDPSLQGNKPLRFPESQIWSYIV